MALYVEYKLTDFTYVTCFYVLYTEKTFTECCLLLTNLNMLVTDLEICVCVCLRVCTFRYSFLILMQNLEIHLEILMQICVYIYMCTYLYIRISLYVDRSYIMASDYYVQQ